MQRPHSQQFQESCQCCSNCPDTPNRTIATSRDSARTIPVENARAKQILLQLGGVGAEGPPGQDLSKHHGSGPVRPPRDISASEEEALLGGSDGRLRLALSSDLEPSTPIHPWRSITFDKLRKARLRYAFVRSAPAMCHYRAYVVTKQLLQDRILGIAAAA